MDRIAEQLTESERQIILECLHAAEQEAFFPEWEFDTLFGLSRNALSRVRQEWADGDCSHPYADAAIIGALNHLLGYPHRGGAIWNRYIHVPPETVRAILKKLLALAP